jgi:D-xylose transport system substrate-binding protein
LRAVTRRAARTACAGSAAVILAVCAGCSSSTTSAPSVSGSAPATGSSAVPKFSVSQVSNKFSAMSTLRPLAARGSGSIAVLLPETATTQRFAEFDAPYLKESFQKAGLAPSQYSVQMVLGDAQLSAARTAIRRGARVLILDARYSGVGPRIESYARARGVPVIDYDWLTLGGSRRFYVGFDSLKIGVLLGLGLVSCVSAWKVRHPQLIVMDGSPTDYNVPLYEQGYNAVLARQFAHGWKVISNPPGTWDQLIALSEFQQQYARHKNLNAALIPNDENGAQIIGFLRQHGVKPRTFPTTGLDATLDGLQNILAGYQCGTVYKPISLEAQAAAALAMYLRAGVRLPTGLVNWHVTDPQTSTSVAAVLLTPEWVTTRNMAATVIADKFVPVSRLCTRKYASACSAAGISG